MKYIALTFVAVCFLFIHSSAQYASKLIEYQPAPGQLINTDGAGSYEAARSVIGSTKGLVSLGSYGGYVVYGFDNPVVNDPDNPYGVDFVIFGNPQPDWSEPGIVMVMKDENHNGKADDTWYELAGSDYFFSTTSHNSSVTYYNPLLSGNSDVTWTSSDFGSGTIYSNSFHKQAYFPSEEFFNGTTSESVTFSGTRIAGKIDTSNPSSQKSFLRRFGYADNCLRNNNGYSTPDNPYTEETEGCGGDAMDIGWAVDAEGNYVNLDQIDFVKIYTGVLASAGWLGEISTEVCGIVDVPANSSLTGTDRCVVINRIPEINFTGDSLQLEAVAFQQGRIVKDKTINWKVSDQAVAEITNTGLLKFITDGTLSLTASLSGDASVQTIVAIRVVTPSYIKIETESNTIRVDDEVVLNAQLYDKNQQLISGAAISWESSNENIASVVEHDGDNYIKGLNEGSTALTAFLADKPSVKTVVTINVIPESSQKNVYVMVKDENSTLYPRKEITVKNFNLNPYVDRIQGNYNIDVVTGVTVAHAVTQAFINMGLSNDFSFRDDNRGNSSLYVWKVPLGDSLNVVFSYGYGGSVESSAFSKCWIVLLNNEQYVTGLDQVPLKNGDELILYHIPDITSGWNISCFLSSKSEISIADTLEVYSSQLTCERSKEGKILIKNSSPVQNQTIMVDNQLAYFNGGQVTTDENGMAELKFSEAGTKKLTAGIDEMVVNVKQRTTVQTISENSGVSIWPCPAKVNFNISLAGEPIREVCLYDTSGRCVKIYHGINRSKTVISVEGVTPGLYIIHITSDTGSSNRKILIQ